MKSTILLQPESSGVGPHNWNDIDALCNGADTLGACFPGQSLPLDNDIKAILFL